MLWQEISKYSTGLPRPIIFTDGTNMWGLYDSAQHFEWSTPQFEDSALRRSTHFAVLGKVPAKPPVVKVHVDQYQMRDIKEQIKDTKTDLKQTNTEVTMKLGWMQKQIDQLNQTVNDIQRKCSKLSWW